MKIRMIAAVVAALGAALLATQPVGTAARPKPSQAHSFLEIGREYYFVVWGEDFRARVLEIGSEDWIEIQRTDLDASRPVSVPVSEIVPCCARTSGDGACKTPEPARPYWINISGVNGILDLQSHDAARAVVKGHGRGFLRAGHRYSFTDARSHTPEILMVLGVPNENWVETVYTAPDRSDMAVPMWLNMALFDQIAEIPTASL